MRNIGHESSKFKKNVMLVTELSARRPPKAKAEKAKAEIAKTEKVEIAKAEKAKAEKVKQDNTKAEKAKDNITKTVPVVVKTRKLLNYLAQIKHEHSTENGVYEGGKSRITNPIGQKINRHSQKSDKDI